MVKEIQGTFSCTSCRRDDLQGDDFYTFQRTGNRHKTCKRCCIRREVKAHLDDGMPAKGYVRKNIDAVRRDTEQHFATYMAANPYYFQGVFGYPATVDNIYRAAVIICREGM